MTIPVRRRSISLLPAALLLFALATTHCARAGVGALLEGSTMEDESVLSRPASQPDSQIHYGPGSEEVADVRFGGPRAASRPLLILLHGGFWRPAYDRVHTRPMSEALAAAGWTVATPEYRRIPGDPDATLHDVRLAIETLPGLVEGHNGQVILVGHSAGGHLVLWAAAAGLKSRLRGVVALAPVADLRLARERQLGGGAVLAFLGAPPEERPEVDPKLMRSPQAAVTIVQGEEDETVPTEIGRSYVAAHPKTRFVPVPGAGHFAVIDPESRAWPIVVQELERLAAP